MLFFSVFSCVCVCVCVCVLAAASASTAFDMEDRHPAFEQPYTHPSRSRHCSEAQQYIFCHHVVHDACMRFHSLCVQHVVALELGATIMRRARPAPT